MGSATERADRSAPIEVVAGLETVIIGAGPSGLAVAACLTERGRPFVLLERSDRVGNAWHNHYDRLHLHTVKQFSHLPYRPFPATCPTYPSRQEVVDYLTDYAEHFGIEPRFGQAVQSARHRSGAWHVRTETSVYQARNLIVATGYNRTPKAPTWPGLDDFEGEVLHSSGYRSGARFAGARVLVVGIGNSGGEIAIDLWEQGARVALCVRSPVHILPRDLMGIPAQVSSLLLSRLPMWLAEWIGELVSRLLVRDLDHLGLRRPKLSAVRQVVELGKIPLVDIGTVDLIRQGAIEVVPGVRAFTPDGVVLTDGRERAFDAVVLATGYTADLGSFLEGAEELTDARGYPTVHGAPAQRPGLYFIGYRNPITGALNDIAKEAVRIADHIARST